MTSPATPPEPKEPKLLRGGRYALLRKLGEGSQGQTYEAMDHGVGPEARQRAARAAPLADKWSRYVRDQKSGGEVPEDARLVAIKCFRVGTARAWKDVELAEREARTLSSLDHPRLPRYFEHFEEDGALYLVMEKIEGESLATIRKQGRAMSAADVTRMLEDIAEALRYLHGRAPLVVHRDIKPGNILRRTDGSFALVDFGAVRDRLKPAGGSTVVGTFGYMAPEQFQGRASPSSDVYGLGATAITMLTGIDPAELPHEGLGIDVTRALPRGTPAALARALAAMLVPDPDRRAGSIDEALAILHARERVSEAEHEGARERGRGKRSKKARAPRPSRKERKQQRALARKRRAPLLPRFLGRLGLLVALIVVWAIVGFAVPVVLILLSLLFGGAFRRAAAACVRAAQSSQRAIGRASMWLSGDRTATEPGALSGEAGRDAKVRVVTETPRVRMAGDDQTAVNEIGDVEAPAEEADAWMEERLEKKAQRDRMQMHAKPPPRRRFWGR